MKTNKTATWKSGGLAIPGFRMRHVYFTLLFAALFFFSSAGRAMAECVFLKDGSVIKGQIVDENGASITVVSSGGPPQVINRVAVLRILYADIYLGKVVVRLTDGTSIDAYLVDENADAYVFRNDIAKVDEYSIPRKRVLFIARTNPTDLRGTVDTASLRVTWFPPYKPPKYYHVYIKEKGAAGFESAGTTTWTFYTIRGLKKKTVYRVIVKAVDDAGAESLPADELELMTNTPPDPPMAARLVRQQVEKGKMPATITWRPASDPDGTVPHYLIYRVNGDTYTLLGQTKGSEYTVTGLDPGTVHRFAVRAVDNDGAESDDAKVNTRVVEFDITARGSFTVPIRDLGEVLRPGYGGLVTFSAANVPVWGMNIGLGSGCLYLTGLGKSVASALMAPMVLSVNYRIMITSGLALSPGLMAGYSFIRIQYRKNNISYHGLICQSKKGYEPCAFAGAVLSYQVRSGWTFLVGVDYGLVFEKRRVLDFITCNAGFGVRI